MSLFTLALFAGCNPQDGELIDATYAAYMSQASPNILPYTQVGDPLPAGLQAVDCRALREADEGQRLEGVDYEAECTDGGEPIDAGWWYWLDDYAYYVSAGPIVPWRVEAVRTIEDDIQLQFHFEVDGIGDSRLGFVIDPDFSPVECVDSGNGGAVQQLIDGEDWLSHWSEGEDATVYMLNASSYQLNPSNTEDYWFLDEDRLAGASFGRFGAEDIIGHGVDYTDYASSAAGVPLYYPGYSGAYSGGSYEEVTANIAEALADNSTLATLGKLPPETSPVSFLFEDNTWRPEREGAVGLANWIGASANWVKIDPGADFEAGKSSGTPKFSGEFQISLDGYDAGGFVFAHGKFKVFNIRDDADAGYENLDEIKREENNTPVCPAG